MLSAREIEDLTERCKYAQAHGIQIALAEEYARELGYSGRELPPKMTEFSPAHLLSLINALGSTPPDPGGPTNKPFVAELGSTPPDPGGPTKTVKAPKKSPTTKLGSTPPDPGGPTKEEPAPTITVKEDEDPQS